MIIDRFSVGYFIIVERRLCFAEEIIGYEKCFSDFFLNLFTSVFSLKFELIAFLQMSY